jgi:hypothetical protein
MILYGCVMSWVECRKCLTAGSADMFQFVPYGSKRGRKCMGRLHTSRHLTHVGAA